MATTGGGGLMACMDKHSHRIKGSGVAALNLSCSEPRPVEGN